LDIFIPDHLLAFEYHGEQHYKDINIFIPQRMYSIRDSQKRMLCKQHAITLIEIPYWWNLEISSLMATIKKYRPELIKVPCHFDPIPEENQTK